MAPMKRPAAQVSAAGQPPHKRQASTASVAKKCETIAAALREAKDLNPSTREMLRAGLQSTLGVPVAERQAFQQKVVGWIEDALTGVRKGLEAEMSAAADALQGVESEKATRDEALASAKAAHAEKLEAKNEKQQAAKDALAAIKTARDAVADAEKAQKAGDEGYQALGAKKEMLTSVMDAFTQLRDASDLQPDVHQKYVKAVVDAGTELEVDKAMITALPSAFSKAPAERGMFDKMVIDQFVEEHKKCVDAVEKALADGAPGKDARAEAVEAAKSALEAAIAAESKAKDDLKEVTDAFGVAHTAVQEATRHVKDFASDLKSAQSEAQAKERNLHNLQKGALADFRDLKDFDGTLPASSQYRQIAGVRFERDLLDIADNAAPITKETAEKLYTAAMDGPGVTATEKRTVRYILKKKDVDGEAKSFLETKIGSSWYQQIDGVTYERLLLSIAESVPAPISQEVASKLWTSAMDANTVTPTERRTLLHIMATKEIDSEAKAFLENKLAAAETPALLEEIDSSAA
eukprot:TRINITY_DN8764_c0_g1_i1.p1 TRINITY_DN8764_c0_g1~~TRINITY_DN8764_c0_g1_i1.p1  ORF type:complete len:546 (-),score=166.24 TRINITY_DN8764_c0_g1_i1:205-1770(-)